MLEENPSPVGAFNEILSVELLSKVSKFNSYVLDLLFSALNKPADDAVGLSFIFQVAREKACLVLNFDDKVLVLT